MATRTLVASPIQQQYHYYEPARPTYRLQREVYYAPEPDYYVTETMVPVVRAEPLNCTDCMLRCLGGTVYGVAACLAGAIEVVLACVGGCCRAACGPGGGEPYALHEPYSWKRYEVNNYEYDMVVYRRPRRNWFQRLCG